MFELNLTAAVMSEHHRMMNLAEAMVPNLPARRCLRERLASLLPRHRPGSIAQWGLPDRQETRIPVAYT